MDYNWCQLWLLVQTSSQILIQGLHVGLTAILAFNPVSNSVSSTDYANTFQQQPLDLTEQLIPIPVSFVIYNYSYDHLPP
jgi:hypothetical protein